MIRLIRWVALAALLCLLVLMLGPFQGMEREVGLTDKPAHSLAFAVITAALFLNWQRGSRLQIAGAAIAIATCVEVLQAVTGRDAELADVMAGGLGVAVVALCWRHRAI